jgi:hypothetical protein
MSSRGTGGRIATHCTSCYTMRVGSSRPTCATAALVPKRLSMGSATTGKIRPASRH